MDSKVDVLQREQEIVHREFRYLETSKYIQTDFIVAQANEICNYLKRQLVAPFQAWETFLFNSIEANKEDFLYKFYLRENEYGVLEPDEDRITALKAQELATD